MLEAPPLAARGWQAGRAAPRGSCRTPQHIAQPPAADWCFRGHIWRRQPCQQSIFLLIFLLFSVLHFSRFFNSYSCLLLCAHFEERVASHLRSSRLSSTCGGFLQGSSSPSLTAALPLRCGTDRCGSICRGRLGTAAGEGRSSKMK